MLLGEQVEWHGAVAVGLHEFLALPFKFVAFCVCSLERVLGLGPHGLHLGADRGFEFDARRVGELSGAVVLDERLFDFGDEDGALGAVCSLRVTPGAYEVGILFAGRRPGNRNDQAFFALPAVQGGLEVVRVSSSTFTVDMSRENVLDESPGRFINERVVPTGVVRALELHKSLVVRVGEHFVKQARAHWL